MDPEFLITFPGAPLTTSLFKKLEVLQARMCFNLKFDTVELLCFRIF